MKRIKVGKYSFEQSYMSANYHLYKDVEVQEVKEGKKTGGTRIDTKIQGYDMPLKAIIKIIAEDEAFECSGTILGLLNRIEIKLDLIEKVILEQLK